MPPLTVATTNPPPTSDDIPFADDKSTDYYADSEKAPTCDICSRYDITLNQVAGAFSANPLLRHYLSFPFQPAHSRGIQTMSGHSCAFVHLLFNSIMCIIIYLYCCEFRSHKLCRLKCRAASSFGWMCCLDGRDESYRSGRFLSSLCRASHSDTI